MLKQKISKLKKTLTILVAVLFVLSVVTIAASAHGGGRLGGVWGWGIHPYWGYGTWLCMGNGNWICPSYSRMQYTVQASKPVESAQAPDPSPNLAGATLFPKTASKDPKTKSAT
jgi:hypothetical protein